MEKNIELNIKNTSGYDILRPQTTCEMVIDLLNSDTKTLMGLEQTDQADDAFRSLFYAITLDGRALINFTVMGNDSTPCTGIIIKSSQFCDSKGNLIQQVQTNNEGKVSVFVNSTSVSISISGYFDLQDYSTSYTVELGQIYDKSITLTRINYLLMTSSTTKMFSNECKRVDVSCVGGGGGGSMSSNAHISGYSTDSCGAGGGGGYGVIQENVSFSSNINYTSIIGNGGTGGQGSTQSGNNGGNSSFLTVLANGGEGAVYVYNLSGNYQLGGSGNGNGGHGAGWINNLSNAGNGKAGNQYYYNSFTNQSLCGGGGGGGGYGLTNEKIYKYGTGGSPFGGQGGVGQVGDRTYSGAGSAGRQYGGGGGGGAIGYNSSSEFYYYAVGGSGGQGCVAIRMYTAQTLLNS